MHERFVGDGSNAVIPAPGVTKQNSLCAPRDFSRIQPTGSRLTFARMRVEQHDGSQPHSTRVQPAVQANVALSRSSKIRSGTSRSPSCDPFRAGTVSGSTRFTQTSARTGTAGSATLFVTALCRHRTYAPPAVMCGADHRSDAGAVEGGDLEAVEASLIWVTPTGRYPRLFTSSYCVLLG